jgi:hypothetical protein
MTAFAEFLQGLLREGRAVLREPPETSCRRDTQAAGVLREAFAAYRLGMAGPAIDFDEKAALAAGELVRQACWALVSRGQTEAEIKRRLEMPGGPRSPAQHLSADLVLRYLPQVHRRARALDPGDVLPGLLANVLRRWPLSGVLSDVDEGPLTALDFGGHMGLRLFYAERLALKERPAWIPVGPEAEAAELVWMQLGKKLPVGGGAGEHENE